MVTSEAYTSTKPGSKESGFVIMKSWIDELKNELTALEAAGLKRRLPKCEREAITLASNDYLGLKDEPSVKAAAAKAAQDFGAGSGGSRLLTGNTAVHVRLEEHLARFKGCEAALVWATGYMANVGTISALMRKGDIIFSDALNHASIIDGCRLSGAKIVVYAHNDMDDLRAKLAENQCEGRRLVVSDAVFSMDGDLLNLPRFLEICREANALSMIDEAHATGVIGKTGRGLAEHFGCDHADVTLGTLSKALGSEGGFVCGARALIDYLTTKSRSFIFSTAPGPAAMAAADQALSLLEAAPARVERLHAKTTLFTDELEKLGIKVKTESAIVPILIGDEHRALEIAASLRSRGFEISAIRYPTVAKGAARLRVAISSEIADEDLRAAAKAIKDLV